MHEAGTVSEQYFTACTNGNLAAVQQCIRENKFVVQYRENSNHNTGLHICAREGHLQVTEELLKAGANCNLKNHDQQTPLSVAVQRADVTLDLIKVLVHHGAEVSETILMELKSSNKDIISFLLRHLSLDQCCNWSVFHYAVYFLTEEEIFESTLDAVLPVAKYVNKRALCYHPLAPSIDAGSTALHLLFSRLHHQDITVSLAKKLLLNGADLNILDAAGNTPFILACQNNFSADVISLLCSYGANVNLTDKKGISPLLWSVVNENKGNVACLLDKNCDLECKIKLQDVCSCAPPHINQSAVSALNFAVYTGNTAISTLLIQKGAKTSHRFCDGSALLHIAVQSCDINVVKLLVSKNSINFQNHIGNTALHKICYKAACMGRVYCDTHVQSQFQLDVVKVLLSCGADVNRSNDNNETALVIACKTNHHELVKCLIMHGANIGVTDRDGCSLLHIAAEKGHTETCNVLLCYGINVNRVSGNGWATAHIAACRENLELMKLLVMHACNINAKVHIKDYTVRGEWDPLNLATEVGALEITNFLIDVGADISGHKSSLPLTHCVVRCKSSGKAKVRTLDKLREHGVDMTETGEETNTLLHEACLANDFCVLKYLLDVGINVNAQNSGKCTPLCLLLKSLSSSRNKPNFCFDSALWRAKPSFLGSCRVSTGDASTYLVETKLKLVNLLLNSGADINIADHSGKTALHVALQAEFPSAVFECLQHSCNVNICDKMGYTPLYFAMSARAVNETVINMLLMKGADYTNIAVGWTFLAFVISQIKDTYKVFHKLLLQGVNVNDAFEVPSYFMNFGVCTNLQLAAAYQPACIPGLLLQGADIHCKSEYGQHVIDVEYVYPGLIKTAHNFFKICLLSAGDKLISFSDMNQFGKQLESCLHLDMERGSGFLEIALRSGTLVDLQEDVTEYQQEAYLKLKYIMKTPLRLEQLTANFVRTSLYPNAWVSVGMLGLPEKLEDLITFDHKSMLQEFADILPEFARFLEIRNNKQLRTVSYQELEAMF